MFPPCWSFTACWTEKEDGCRFVFPKTKMIPKSQIVGNNIGIPFFQEEVVRCAEKLASKTESWKASDVCFSPQHVPIIHFVVVGGWHGSNMFLLHAMIFEKKLLCSASKIFHWFLYKNIQFKKLWYKALSCIWHSGRSFGAEWILDQGHLCSWSWSEGWWNLPRWTTSPVGLCRTAYLEHQQVRQMHYRVFFSCERRCW